MTQSTLPISVQRVLKEQIGSVVALETLLLFFRQPYRRITSDQVATELRVASYWTRNELDSLAHAGLLQFDHQGMYHYDPSDSFIHESVVAVADAYSSRPMAVIYFIYSRSDAARHDRDN